MVKRLMQRRAWSVSGAPRAVRDTADARAMKAMARDGLLRRVTTGWYVGRERARNAR
jgi:hypothetical protein